MKHSALELPRTALLSLLALMLAAPIASAQDGRLQLPNFDRLAAEAVETVDVTLDETMLKFAGAFINADEGGDPDAEVAKKLVQGLRGVYVKSFKFDKEGAYTEADVEPLRAQLRAPGWSKMVVAKSRNGEDVEVFALVQGETLGGLAIIATEPRELTVVNVVGTIDPAAIRQLNGRFGVPEFEVDVRKDVPSQQQQKP
jgi:hypothetical protein